MYNIAKNMDIDDIWLGITTKCEYPCDDMRLCSDEQFCYKRYRSDDARVKSSVGKWERGSLNNKPEDYWLDCVVSHGMWSEVQCDNNYAFICERGIGTVG